MILNCGAKKKFLNGARNWLVVDLCLMFDVVEVIHQQVNRIISCNGVHFGQSFHRFATLCCRDIFFCDLAEETRFKYHARKVAKSFSGN